MSMEGGGVGVKKTVRPVNSEFLNLYFEIKYTHIRWYVESYLIFCKQLVKKVALSGEGGGMSKILKEKYY